MKRNILCRGVFTLTCSFLLIAHRAFACEPTDFFSIPVPQGAPNPESTALELAYPGLSMSSDGESILIDGQAPLDIGIIRDIEPSERLLSPTIAEQFFYLYPLDWDLKAREQPFFDPGRLRNDGFFRALYFQEKASARQLLTRVSYSPVKGVDFWMTKKWGVNCQFETALNDIANSPSDFTRYFENIGGSFVWRTISGTSRLSAHSFGIAFDLNPQFGQYWKWTGAQEGEVVDYNNRMPEALVRTFEQYGFIWGGKWNHFDGMHFEYRPELILYSRMIDK